MKVLIINGSHRKGNTDIAVQKVTNLLKDKALEVKELVLRDIEMKLPDGCADCAESELCKNVRDEFSEKIEPTIHDYDIYIIASPTWDDGITPLMKIFWDRIVSWCHDDRKYLKNKKLAIITHGMADEDSWIHPINWVKSVCVWEEAIFAGSLTFESGSEVGDVKLDGARVGEFVRELIYE